MAGSIDQSPQPMSYNVVNPPNRTAAMRHVIPPTYATAVCLALLSVSSARAVSPLSDADLKLFESKVRPILVEHCYQCHSADAKKLRGNLYLDSKAGWQRGGDSGPAVVPGDAKKSLLLKAIRYKDPDLQMPPKGKLPKEAIAALENWVLKGAPDPRTGEAGSPAVPARRSRIDLEKGRQFWSFRPVANQPPPTVKDSAWPRTPIDRFILAKLEATQLKPTGDADRRTLIRRVYFDLVGLPPTPSQIKAFLNDPLPTPRAFEKVVDELLASPRFGERWGRHWLDIARFAESSGGGRDLLFDKAWRYRDYVIDSFNRDRPFDQFIRQQIAGDLLPYDSPQERADNVTAVGYLTLGPTNYELQDKALLRMEVVDEQIDTVGRTFLAMTLGCARCHDHPFDPVPTTDYYAFAGIFRSTKTLTPGNVSGYETQELPLSPTQRTAWHGHNVKVKALEDRIKAAKATLSKLNPKAASLQPVLAKSRIVSDPSELDGVVVDDVSAALTGTWNKSTFFKAYVGAGYQHANANASATFQASLPKAGRYEVRLAYSPGTNRSSKTRVTVKHADGTNARTINQKRPGPIDGLFVSLGTYRFGPDTPAVVTITTDGANGVVIVDAVQWLPVETKAGENAASKPLANNVKSPPVLPVDADKPRPLTPDDVDNADLIRFIVPDPKHLPGVILDNSQAKLIGTWQRSVHTPPFVGVSYIHDQKQDKGKKSATFTPELPSAGWYDVLIAHNSNVRRAVNAPVTVRHADGQSKLRINEQVVASVGRLFKPIGRFRFARGNAGSVMISTEGTDGLYVIVDAVWFRPADGPDGSFTAAKLAGVLPYDSPAPSPVVLAAATKAETQQQAAAERKAQAADLQEQIKRLEGELATLKKNTPQAPQRVMAVRDEAKPEDWHVNIRGNIRNLGPKVPRGFLTVAWHKQEPPKITQGQSGRLELANWIASPDNPLTARVLANRVWHHLFGHGLVRTTDNFGDPGQRPSHPELLDHLATQFIEDGWSVKSLIRRIAISRTYQLDSRPTADAASLDPENRLLSHRYRRRLDAEAIHDTLLAVSGELDLTVGGKTMRKVGSSFNYRFDVGRRAVYHPSFRNTLHPLLEVFDFADPNLVVGSRPTSTLPTQALFMLNSPLVMGQAEQAAKRFTIDPRFGQLSAAQRIDLAFEQAVGRPATPREHDLTRQQLATFEQPNSPEAWASVFHALFASVDFRHVR